MSDDYAKAGNDGQALAVVARTRPPTENRLERLPDAEPPEQLSMLAGEYIGLSIAGGLVLGLVVGALLPSGPGRKLSRRALKLAALAGEAALVLGQHAGESGQDARAKLGKLGKVIGENNADLRARGGELASTTARQLRETGFAVAQKAIARLTKASDSGG